MLQNPSLSCSYLDITVVYMFWMAIKCFWIELNNMYKINSKLTVCIGSLLRTSTSAWCICSGVPSKKRPQPPWNRVSPEIITMITILRQICKYIFISIQHWHLQKQERFSDVYHPLACLDQYTSTTLNNVSWNFEPKRPNDLEGQGQWPPFSIPVERIPRCIFHANLMILARICNKLSCGQAKLPRILSQMAKMTLKIKVNDSNFITS